MTEKPKISCGQLTALLFAGRLSGCLLFSSDQLTQFSVTDCLLTSGLNGALLFLLFLPTLWLLKKREEGTLERAYALTRGAGKAMEVGYLLLCLFILLLDMVQFSDFATKTLREGFSVSILIAVFVGVCILASRCGIQAIARASAPVAMFSALCLLLFAITLFPQIRWFHFSPPTSTGAIHAVRKAIADLPRSAEVTAIGLLYPYVNGSRVRSCGWFCGLTALFTAFVSVTAVGVLGGFSAMTAYPFYQAVGAAHIGILQRLDVLVIAVWLGTFFVRFTLFARLLLERVDNLFGETKRGVATVFLTLLLIGVAFLMQQVSYNGEWELVTAVYWWMLGAFCLILPVVLAIGGRRFVKV